MNAQTPQFETTRHDTTGHETTGRKTYMGVLARANPAHLAALFPDLPAHDLLRPPEVGAVMVQGRIGGSGAPFNLGEVTVTRCSVRLPDGAIGHAYVQGRDKAHALRAALIDAQVQAGHTALHHSVIAPLHSAEAASRTRRATKAAATKVEFFTMVRGEDQ
jgi:alpha-D-ribose 1-methylphosphonate 5-triphosphate synthase subunit PhnG